MSKHIKRYPTITEAVAATDLISPNCTGVYTNDGSRIMLASTTRGAALKLEGTTLENLHYVEPTSKHTITYDSEIGAAWITTSHQPAPTEVDNNESLHIYTYEPVPSSVLYVDVLMGGELIGKCDLHTGEYNGCITLEPGLDDDYTIKVDIDQVTSDVSIVRNV